MGEAAKTSAASDVTKVSRRGGFKPTTTQRTLIKLCYNPANAYQIMQVLVDSACEFSVVINELVDLPATGARHRHVHLTPDILTHARKQNFPGGHGHGHRRGFGHEQMAWARARAQAQAQARARARMLKPQGRIDLYQQIFRPRENGGNPAKMVVKIDFCRE